MKRQAFLLPAALALAAMTACSDQSEQTDAPMAEGESLAAIIADDAETSAMAAALDRTGLAGVFDGPGGYTVLVPVNAALDPIAAGNGDDGNNAVVAAILREHILPGQLDLAAISEAIDANDGKVAVSTVGKDEVVLTRDGDVITARLADGDRTARLTGTERQGPNGGVLMIDRLLVVPPSD